ncbi:MAG: iron-containing alcohol dehydrogenase [Spongiibacteraceae bacterium]
MNNFDLYNPTRISFGRERIARIDKYIPADAKVLILYGGGSAERNGTLAEVRAALGERAVEEFSGIEANPQFDTLMKAVAVVNESNIDFLLAVGGGSVIDGCKFIAAASKFSGDAWEILTRGGRNITAALPFGSVLTLPATGSEMNSGGVVTRKSLNAKLSFSSPLLFPQFSVLDPTKCYTLPHRQIANGVVDAFVHIVEQYLTYPVNAAVQDRFAEGLLLTLIEYGPQALDKPEDYDIRANLMWVATLALNGLIGAGVPQDWATHMIGHELTAQHGLDHAQTLAVVLPAALALRQEQKHAKLLQYAERVWGLKDGNEQTRIDTAITNTRAFFEDLGVATRLRDYAIGEQHIDALVDALEDHGLTALGEHRDVDLAMSRRILQSSL